jgi:hypothetical protein
MISVVVDIDDTLINTQRRVRAVWSRVLDREIPTEDVETLSSRQILQKFAPSDRKSWSRFWKVLLCSDQSGVELLKLDEPVPFAADVLQRWSKQCTLVYFTGRPENTRELTLNELKRLGFPTDDAQLAMFDPQDWQDFISADSLLDARFRVFSSLSRQFDIVRVVDDYPTFFNVYRQFNVPDRIGLLRPKRFSPRDYLREGATRVVESWSQLLDDPPRQSS